MICAKPISIKVGQVFPCGQCLPCLLNRRRLWTHRIILEAAQHADNCFLTLTYREDDLPLSHDGDKRLATHLLTSNAHPTLAPLDLRNFLKRLRKQIEPTRIRFYAVGEYGDETLRPHYHLALFGFPTCLRGRTKRHLNTSRPTASECCDQCRMVQSVWPFGLVDLGTLEVSSAQYVAQYVTKKMRLGDGRLDGRYPEFARMSLRPGLGLAAMKKFAEALIAHDLVDPEGDVPSALRHGSRLMPIGRYLRKNLRIMVGRDEKAPQSTLDEMAEKLRPLREAVESVTSHPTMARFKRHLLAELTREVFEEDVARLVNHERIYKRKGSL